MKGLDKSSTQNLPEAPASVTARVVTDKGFRILFTLRDSSVSGLISKFEQFEKAVLARGWKPETNQAQVAQKTAKVNGSKGVTVSQAVCDKCGAPATKKSGYRKDGSLWEGVFCSTGDESHKIWLS